MFIYRPINVRARPVRYCSNAVRYASLCSCCTPSVAYVGVHPKKFSALFARSDICTPPLLKLWRRPCYSSATILAENGDCRRIRESPKSATTRHQLTTPILQRLYAVITVILFDCFQNLVGYIHLSLSMSI